MQFVYLITECVKFPGPSVLNEDVDVELSPQLKAATQLEDKDSKFFTY